MPPSPLVRLLREQKILLNDKANGTLQGVSVAQDPRTALKWHFVLYDFDMTSPFHGGCYHGFITYPNNYPYAPPNIKFVTPNGRFVPEASICLSMSDFHPETWNPAWNMVTLLLGIRSFMEDECTTAYPGCCNSSLETRRRLAEESWAVNGADKVFCELFPEIVAKRRG